ncbi:MAG TPA: pseudoazurin [Paracoccaceae bacterium]|nr:pseudoazurin [Paracoccaceae bacterium]
MKFASLLLAATLASAPAFAAEHVVEMLNKGDDGMMVFQPGLIRAEIGDTVRFVPTDRGHNVETIEGFIPEGYEMVLGAMDQEVILEITAEGLYGLRCKPHFGLGMVALIVAGDIQDPDLPEDVKLPRKAKERFEAWLEVLEGE